MPPPVGYLSNTIQDDHKRVKARHNNSNSENVHSMLPPSDTKSTGMFDSDNKSHDSISTAKPPQMRPVNISANTNCK